MKKITEKTITSLLAYKHREDVFVSQCKDGRTWGRKVAIMDVWAMKKAWKNPHFTCYEIKTSRADFLNDDKWQQYLINCNSFYFVCPTGLISLSEVPEKAGLMYVSKTGTKLYTKKKAVYRDIQINQDVLLYILMSRAKIIKSTYGKPLGNSNIDTMWEAWLAKKHEDRRYGRHLGKKIQETVRDHITVLKAENAKLESKIRSYDIFRKLFESWGLDITYLSSYNAEKILKKKFGASMDVDNLQHYLRSVDSIIRSSSSMKQDIENRILKAKENQKC